MNDGELIKKLDEVIKHATEAKTAISEKRELDFVDAVNDMTHESVMIQRSLKFW